MEGKLLIFLLVVCAASKAVALQCYVCPASGICPDGEAGDLQTCPTIPGFTTTTCMKFDGEMSGSVAEIPISFKGVMRSCNPVLEGGDSPPNQCLSGSEVTSYLDKLLASLGAGGATSVADAIDIDLKGKICYCAVDGCNGVDSLKPLFWLTLIAVVVMRWLLM